MNTNRLLLRLIVSLIILTLLLVTYIYQAFKHWFLFLRYGGEFMHYKKDDVKRMTEIYELLKSKP